MENQTSAHQRAELNPTPFLIVFEHYTSQNTPHLGVWLLESARDQLQLPSDRGGLAGARGPGPFFQLFPLTQLKNGPLTYVFNANKYKHNFLSFCLTVYYDY